MKKTLLLLFLCTIIIAHIATAQNIFNAEQNATPISINPAFTGMFNGNVRVCSEYSSYWTSVTAPYISNGASVDMPLITGRYGSYFAVGISFHRGVIGDGNVSNFNTGISLAYHKLFGKLHHKYDLALGIQSGYNQTTVDLATLYFGNQFTYGSNFQGIGAPYRLGIGNSLNYYFLNTGLSLSHESNKFNYTLGASVNNLNAPNSSLVRKADGTNLLNLRYIGEAIANWSISKRLTLNPEIFYQNGSGSSYFIAGNEFRYKISRNIDRINPTSVFIGGWFQSDDIVKASAGIELKGFRLGLGYGYGLTSIGNASNGQGGFEISLKYIASGRRSGSRKKSFGQ